MFSQGKNGDDVIGNDVDDDDNLWVPVASLETDEPGPSLPCDWLATARAPEHHHDFDDYDDVDVKDHYDEMMMMPCDRLTTACKPDLMIIEDDDMKV